nr:immunoglobulin heavy chain junction region [Macaca mulatta]MOV48268.1 immunoglobulin heavy chain junction region [Macaca mulatta]MOV48572.1 immunoglobulin heavy chain junction region [Macaca mulatta]
CVRVQSNFDSW